MANISRIDIRIKTGNRTGAGSSGTFYVGIGGREFRLNIPGTNDFEQNMDQIFTLGEASNLENASHNDPRSPVQLITENLNKYPKYIRFEPENSSDNWNLEFISVTVNPGTGQTVFSGLGGNANLWLGARNTKIFYFGA
jgi:hypothetical protein